jgi:hypothetical protein
MENISVRANLTHHTKQFIEDLSSVAGIKLNMTKKELEDILDNAIDNHIDIDFQDEDDYKYWWELSDEERINSINDFFIKIRFWQEIKDELIEMKATPFQIEIIKVFINTYVIAR